MKYNNMPTVVVCIINICGKLLVVRRADNKKLALPGGYQMQGETWQQAGAREVFEETGIKIDSSMLLLCDVITVPNANLLFCITNEKFDTSMIDNTVAQKEEVEEILFLSEVPQCDSVAFQTHYDQMLKNYFQARDFLL